MSTETLTCSADHTWEREIKRGRKPTTCPEHIAEAKVKPPKAHRSTLAEKLFDRAMEALEGLPGGEDNEDRRKVEYIAMQAASGFRDDAAIIDLDTTLGRIIR